MDIHDPTFDVTLSQIPLWNLRNEFSIYFNLLRNEDVCKSFGYPYKPISSPIIIAPQDLFLTIATQRSIVGLESYIVGALYFEAGTRRILDDKLLQKLKRTNRFEGANTADKLYNTMPSIIDSNFALKKKDPELWELTKALYQNTRNLLFHGYEFSNQSPYKVRGIFEVLYRLHVWVDEWHSPESLNYGA